MGHPKCFGDQEKGRPALAGLSSFEECQEGQEGHFAWFFFRQIRTMPGVSTYCVEVVESGSPALWTRNAVLIKCVSGLESRIQHFLAEPGALVNRTKTELPVPFPCGECRIVSLP
jgi:hypothetical protein